MSHSGRNFLFWAASAAGWIAWAIAGASSLPAEPSASLRLTKARADIGEPVAAVFEANWEPDAYDYRGFETANEDQASSWTLKLRGGPPPEPNEEKGSFQAELIARGWDLGAMKIESPKLLLRATDGTLESVEARSVGLEIVPTEAFQPLLEDRPSTDGALKLVADAGELPALRDRRGQLGPPPTWWERNRARLGFLLAATALAILAFDVVRWLRRPRPVYVPSSDEWAMGELTKLESAPLSDQKHIEEFHFRLAEILRLYCGRRWVFPSAKMTTDELAFSLEKLAPDLAETRRLELISLMEDADMVKFARYPAAKITCQKRLEQSRGFVEATRPPEEANELLKSAGDAALPSIKASAAKASMKPLSSSKQSPAAKITALAKLSTEEWRAAKAKLSPEEKRAVAAERLVLAKSGSSEKGTGKAAAAPRKKEAL
jgi:hypothetical protein